MIAGAAGRRDHRKWGEGAALLFSFRSRSARLQMDRNNHRQSDLSARQNATVLARGARNGSCVRTDARLAVRVKPVGNFSVDAEGPW